MGTRLRVKEVAEQKGFNQASLARKADIDFKTVKRLFRDPYHDVSLYILNKIAQALEVPTSALLEDVPDDAPK